MRQDIELIYLDLPMPRTSRIMKRLLREDGVSLKESAKCLKLSELYIKRILTGQRKIPIVYLVKFMKTFSLTVDDKNALMGAYVIDRSLMIRMDITDQMLGEN